MSGSDLMAIRVRKALVWKKMFGHKIIFWQKKNLFENLIGQYSLITFLSNLFLTQKCVGAQNIFDAKILWNHRYLFSIYLWTKLISTVKISACPSGQKILRRNFFFILLTHQVRSNSSSTCILELMILPAKHVWCIVV